jgi:hypothetical protein
MTMGEGNREGWRASGAPGKALSDWAQGRRGFGWVLGLGFASRQQTLFFFSITKKKKKKKKKRIRKAEKEHRGRYAFCFAFLSVRG